MSDVFTPYKAAKYANTKLTAAGLKSIPSQMMYNYTTARLNKGKAPYIQGTMTKDGFEVDKADLDRWIQARIEKAAPEKAVADPEQAEFDLAEAN